MWRLAFRQISYDPLRSVLTVLAIAAAIAVILALRGFEQGLYVQSKTVVLDRGGQLIGTQAGISNFLAARSSLPQLTRIEVEAVKGVAAAHPLTGFHIVYGPEGNKFPVLLLVYDDLGGPVELIAGEPIKDAHDVVVDIGLSKRFNLKPGDRFTVSDFDFTVSGITRNSSALFSAMAFVSYDGMIDLFLESEIAPDISTFPLLSFLLVELEKGAEPQKVAQAIERQVPEVDVFTPQALARNDVALSRELFGSIMTILVSLAYIIGMLVIGFIIHADVSSRRRDFGVMKALGFKLSQLAGAVIVQTAMLVTLAFPVGVTLALAIAFGIESRAPVYLIPVLDPPGLLSVAAGTIVMLLAGSLLPLRLIWRTDPIIVFQTD